MPRTSPLIIAALLAALGAAAYAGYRAHTRQAAVLHRMAALAACLAARNQQRAQAAKVTVDRIAESVSKNHNLPRDVYVLKESEQIQARTGALADTLALTRRQWQQAGSSSRLVPLAAQLSSYVDFIHLYYPEAMPLTWQPAAEPLPAALATLTCLETQVRQYGATALEAQNRKVGSGCCMCFTRIDAFAFPVSQTVASGALYEARLFLTKGTAGLKQYMSANGRPVSIDPKTNHGLVRFRIPAARPGRPDTVRAAWSAAVRINNNGRDTVLMARVPYFIVKRPTL